MIKRSVICMGAAGLLVTGCGTTVEQRAATGALGGAAAGALIGESVGAAAIGGLAGAALGAVTAEPSAPANRRQYYDQRAGRYYFVDPVTSRSYWEDGTPRT